jgi:hypothetical protein
MTDKQVPHEISTIQIASVAAYLSTESRAILKRVTGITKPSKAASPQLIKQMETIIRTATEKMFEEKTSNDILQDMVENILDDLKRSNARTPDPRRG